MNIFSLIGIALIATFLSVILKKSNKEYAMVISIIAGIFIISKIFIYLISVLSSVKSILAVSNISKGYIAIIFKAIGICFLTQFSSNTCIDAGESALASKIEFAGKIAVIIIALPLIEDIIKIVNSLIG